MYVWVDGWVGECACLGACVCIDGEDVNTARRKIWEIKKEKEQGSSEVTRYGKKLKILANISNYQRKRVVQASGGKTTPEWSRASGK